MDFLLILDTVARRGWVSGRMAARAIQRSEPETNDVLDRLRSVTFGDVNRVIVGVDGDPQSGRDPYHAAWQLDSSAKARLASSRRHHGPPRDRLLADYADQRGRISSTEAASLLGASTNTARAVLDDLERDGILASGREQRRGRGFFYTPVRVAIQLVGRV